MTNQQWWYLGIAVLLSVAAAFLAAVEAALRVLSHARAQELNDQGKRNAALVVDIANDKAHYVNTVTLLRTIFEVCAALLVARLVFDHFDVLWQELLIAGAGLVLIWFIFWGVGPRTLGQQHAMAVVSASARLLSTLTTVFGPIAQLLILIGNAITPGKGYAEGPFATEAELRELVDIAEAREVIEHGEREMIHSVFELGDTLVREVMVPRPDVVFIEADKTLRQGLSLCLRSGFSRIPVISDDLDDVVGILYLKDVMRRIFNAPDSERREPVSALMRKPTFVPDSKPIDELMSDMQRNRSHLVIVVDEFGGTSGVATIEDIVEEIFGEITDEYDAEPTLATPLDGGGYRVSVRMALDEVGDLFSKELDDEDVDTVGGLMAKQLSMVPIEGSVVCWGGLEFTADPPTGRRHQVETLMVRPAPADTNADSDEDDE